MDSQGQRNAPMFEEMQVLKFKLFVWDVCSGLPSLKKASKVHAIEGIILSLCVIFLVLGLGWHYLTSRHGLTDASYYGAMWTFMFGATSLLVGTLLLIYNLILLSSVMNNQGVRVFKIIKVGCLILLYLQLIVSMVSLFLVSILVFDHPDSFPNRNQVGVLTGILVDLLFLFLRVLVIYAIHSVKPGILSLYIYITATLVFLCAIFVGAFIGGFMTGYIDGFQSVDEVYGLTFPVLTIIGILVIIFVVSILDYYLKIFVLHRNMMTRAPVSINHHPQLTTI